MIGCGQQRGRMGTQAPTESGDGNSLMTGLLGEVGAAAQLGLVQDKAGRRQARGEPMEPTVVCWPWWSVRGKDEGEEVSRWCPWPTFM